METCVSITKLGPTGKSAETVVLDTLIATFDMGVAEGPPSHAICTYAVLESVLFVEAGSLGVHQAITAFNSHKRAPFCFGLSFRNAHAPTSLIDQVS